MAFQIIRNNMVHVCADALVNTANPLPICGSGTDLAMYIAAGEEELLSARRRIGEIAVGEAAYTPAFALHAKYIIHAAGPVWKGGEHGELELLRNAYQNSLKLAQELGCRSIAFPLISTGALGLPKRESLKIAVEAFSKFLLDHEMDITLVVFDNESFALGGKIFEGLAEYIDRHEVEAKLREEYPRGRTRYLASRASRFSSASRTAESKSAEESKFRLEPDEDTDVCFSSLPEDIDFCVSASLEVHEEECRFDDVEKSFPGDAAKRSPDVTAKHFKEDHSSDDFKKRSLSDIKESSLGDVKEHSLGDMEKRSLEDVMKRLSETWQESLLRLIDEKSLSDVEVYKRANADRKLFSKIRGNSEYQPKKHTAVAFALALRLNLDDTKDFLAKAGYALSDSSKFDLIITYFVEREVYDIYMINLALFEHGQTLLI